MHADIAVLLWAEILWGGETHIKGWLDAKDGKDQGALQKKQTWARGKGTQHWAVSSVLFQSRHNIL